MIDQKDIEEVASIVTGSIASRRARLHTENIEPPSTPEDFERYAMTKACACGKLSAGSHRQTCVKVRKVAESFEYMATRHMADMRCDECGDKHRIVVFIPLPEQP